MKTITVWTAVYEVLRSYNMTTVFSNPGSTEEPLLKNFPSDFRYILGLQEASVMGMADGYIRANTQAALYEAMQQARQVDGPALTELQISPKFGTLPI